MKKVWYVNRPTHMAKVQPPAYWQIERVEAGSERDKMLATRRTVNDAGELVEIPGEWWRFESLTEAKAWMRAEAQRYQA